MPTIYLSPSTQPFNLYADGVRNEEAVMNQLADRLEPYLTTAGISYVRKDLSQSAGDAIRASNAGLYDLHLALHSNASPESSAGQNRGILVFYYPGSVEGQRASELIAAELAQIYPLPDKSKAVPTTSIGEVSKVTAPSSFLEIGFHDNVEDAEFLRNLDPIAEQIAKGVTSYFGLPYLIPQPERAGEVDVRSGHLNIRSGPGLTYPVVGTAVDGTPVTILNEYEGFYVVRLGELLGYAAKEYIDG